MNDRSIRSNQVSAPLDRNQLRRVRDNFLAFNEKRLHFAQAILGDAQRSYLDLLPALLHFNHPMLPGYCNRRTPAGVYEYQLSTAVLQGLRRLAKSFHPNRSNNQRPDIVALFTMGSLGSLAQNEQSDIDIWLCYRPDLPEEGIALLREKAAKITEWAASLGVDTTLFLMNHREFCNGSNQQLDKESSGNTQHFLLLDEFYRTAIYLSGQLPIWLFIVDHRVEHYIDEVNDLREEKRLPDKQLIDFGVLETIPSGEFIGAAIWQLYKAIESPYKSIIKLLLIEIYATNNRSATFLSNQYKHWLQTIDNTHALSLSDFDPFYRVYQTIEAYLLASQQESRLELVRRCFYFKIVNENKLSAINAKQTFIDNLVKEWGWDAAFLEELNQRQHWKIDTVNRERGMIVNALNKSYRFIIEFFKKEKVSINASNKELNILGRKLHAAFTKKVGKVEWLNPGIAKNITEERVVIYQQKNGLWVAANQWQQKLLRKKSYVALLVSLYCNQIIGKQTKITLRDGDEIPLKNLFNKVQASLPDVLMMAEHSSFEKACRVNKIILFIHDFNKPDFFIRPEKADYLHYYLKQPCTIDIVTLNSWNEIFCEQQQGILQEIVPQILSQYIDDANALAHVDVHFFDSNAQQYLQDYVVRLYTQLSQFFKDNSVGQYILSHNDGYSVLSNKVASAAYQFIKTHKQLCHYLSMRHDDFCALAVDESLQYSVFALFAKYNKKNCIQLFFEVKSKVADVTIIDEQGSFYFLTVPYTHYQESLLPIYNYCRSVNERRLNTGHVDLSPLDILPISIYQLRQNKQGYSAEQVYLNHQVVTPNRFSIHGFAEYKNNDFIFTLYCDEQRFSEEDEQAAAFKKMLKWMRSQSQSNGASLDYAIEDLDISHCQQAFSPESIHTSHYLQVKSVLEHKIQQAFSTYH